MAMPPKPPIDELTRREEGYARLEKVEIRVETNETEFRAFVAGMMGTNQFPGGAFGRLESAMRDFAEEIKQLPQKIDKAIEAHDIRQRERLFGGAWKQLGAIVGAVIIGVITAVLVLNFTGSGAPNSHNNTPITTSSPTP